MSRLLALVAVSPALIVVWSGMRYEAETTLTAWVGVLGYTRSERFMGIPVYQNFLDLGSRLPLAAQVSSSPLSMLGSLFTVDQVQVVLVSIFLVWFSQLVVGQSVWVIPKSIQLSGIFFLSLFAVTHYFLVNDWSELVFGFLGMWGAVLLATSMHFPEFRWNRYSFGLLGFSVFSTTLSHAGYVGVAFYSLLAIGAVSMFFPGFRANLFKPLTMGLLAASVAVMSLTWADTALFLLSNEVLGNPRYVSPSNVAWEILTLGLITLPDGENWYSILSARPMIVPWPLILFAVLRSFGNHRRGVREFGLPAKKVLIFASVFIGILSLVAPMLDLPLEPSANYLLRDGSVVAGILAFQLTFARPSPEKSVKELLLIKRLDLGSALTVVAILTLGLGSRAFLPPGSDANLNSTYACYSEGGSEVFWQEPTIWRGSQPDRFGKFSPCSMPNLVETGQFSLGAWLKMRQSLLDDEPRFGLENKSIGSFDTLKYGFSLPDYIEVDGYFNSDMRSAENLKFVRHDSALEYEFRRCDDGCVFTAEFPGAGEYLIPWNYDEGLRADFGLLSRASDGLVQIAIENPADVVVTYSPPIAQRVSIISSWVLLGIQFLPALTHLLPAWPVRKIKLQTMTRRRESEG